MRWNLDSITKFFRSFNDALSTIGLLVATAEPQSQKRDEDQYHNIAPAVISHVCKK
jgi:hypothetical protein